eukprot:Selendium_serpulae@DN4985_c0_g2_i1.p2
MVYVQAGSRRLNGLRARGKRRVLTHHSWQAVLDDWVRPAVEAKRAGVAGWYRSADYLMYHGRKHRHRHVVVLRGYLMSEIERLRTNADTPHNEQRLFRLNEAARFLGALTNADLVRSPAAFDTFVRLVYAAVP